MAVKKGIERAVHTAHPISQMSILSEVGNVHKRKSLCLVLYFLGGPLRTEVDAKSPDVPSNKADSYWDELKLSLNSIISLIDIRFTTKQLMFSTFFSFVPKSGKRISMLIPYRNKSLARQDFITPSSLCVTTTSHRHRPG